MLCATPRIHEYKSLPNDIDIHRPKRLAFAREIHGDADVISEDGRETVAGEAEDPDSKTGKDVYTKVVATS